MSDTKYVLGMETFVFGSYRITVPQEDSLLELLNAMNDRIKTLESAGASKAAEPIVNPWGDFGHPTYVTSAESKTVAKTSVTPPSQPPKPESITAEFRELIMDIAHEAHTQGRIYASGGERIKPGDEWVRIEEYVNRTLNAYFTTKAAGEA